MQILDLDAHKLWDFPGFGNIDEPASYDNSFGKEFLENDEHLFINFPSFFEEFLFKQPFLINSSKSIIEIEIVFQLSKSFLKKLSIKIVDKIKNGLDVLNEEGQMQLFLSKMLKFVKWYYFDVRFHYCNTLTSAIKIGEIIFTNEIIDLVVFSDNWDLIHLIYSCFSCLRNTVLDDQEVSTSQFEKLVIILEFLFTNKYRLLDDSLIEKKNSYEKTILEMKNTAILFENNNDLQMDYFSGKKKTGETLLIKNIKNQFDFKESSFQIVQKIIEKEALSKSTIENQRNYISLLFHIKVLKQLDSNPKGGFVIFLCNLINQVLKPYLFQNFNCDKFTSYDFTFETINFSYMYLMLNDIEQLLGEDYIVKLLETFISFDRIFYDTYLISSEKMRSAKLQYSQALLDFLIKKLAKCQKNEAIVGLIIISLEFVLTRDEKDFKIEDSIAEQVLLVFQELTERTKKNILIEQTFIESNPDVILACVYYFFRTYNANITKKYMEHVQVFWQEIISAILAKDETTIENQFLYQIFLYYIVEFIWNNLKLNRMYKGSIQELFEQLREKIKTFKNSKNSSIFNFSIAIQFRLINFGELSEKEMNAFILLLSDLNLLGFYSSQGYSCKDYLRSKIEKYTSVEEIKKDEEFFNVLTAYLKATFNSKAIYDFHYLLAQVPAFFKDYLIEELAKYLTEALDPILIQEQELIQKLITKSEISFVEKQLLIYLSRKHECYSKDINYIMTSLLENQGIFVNYKDYKIIYDFMRKSLTPIVNLSARESYRRTYFFFEKFNDNENGIKTNTKIALQNIVDNFSDFEKAAMNILNLKLENDFFIDKFHKHPNFTRYYSREMHATILNDLLVYFSKVENKEEIYKNWKIVKEFEFDFQFLLDTTNRYGSDEDRQQECFEQAKNFFVNFTNSKLYFNILMTHSKEYLPFSINVKNKYVKNGNYASAFSCSEDENIFKPFLYGLLDYNYYYKKLRSGFCLFKNLYNIGYKMSYLFPNENDLLYYGVSNSLANYFFEEIDKYSDEERFLFCFNVSSIIYRTYEKIPVPRYPQLLHFYREAIIGLSRLFSENNITEDVTTCKETDDRSFKNIILYYTGKNLYCFIKDKIISSYDGNDYLKSETMTLKEAYDLIDNEYVPIFEAMLSIDANLKSNDILSIINSWIPGDSYVSTVENEKQKLIYFATKIVHPFLKYLCSKQIEYDSNEYIRLTVEFFTKFSTFVWEYEENDPEGQLKQYAVTRCGILDILQNILDSLNINFKLINFSKVFEESYSALNSIKYDGQMKFDIEGLSVNCKINLFLNLIVVLIKLSGIEGVENGQKILNSSFNFRYKYLSLVKELKKLILDNKNQPFSNKSAFFLLSFPLDADFVEIPQELDENSDDLYKLFIEYSNFLRSFLDFKGFKNNHVGSTFKNVLDSLLQILNKLEKLKHKEYLTKCFEEVLIILENLKDYEIETNGSFEQERFSFLILILKTLKFFDREATFCTSSIELSIKNCFIDNSTGKIKEFIDDSCLNDGLKHHEKLNFDSYCRLLLNLCDIKKRGEDNQVVISLKKNIGLFLSDGYEFVLTDQQKKIFNIIFMNIVISILNVKEDDQKNIYYMNHRLLVEILKYIVKLYPSLIPIIKKLKINLVELEKMCIRPQVLQKILVGYEAKEIEAYKLFELIAPFSYCTINQLLLLFVTHEKGFKILKNEDESIYYISNKYIKYIEILKSIDLYFSQPKNLFESVFEFMRFNQIISLGLILIDESENIHHKKAIEKETILLKRILKNSSELFANLENIAQFSHFFVNSKIFIFYKKIFKKILKLQITLRVPSGVEDPKNLKKCIRHYYSKLSPHFEKTSIDHSKYEREEFQKNYEYDLEFISKSQEKLIYQDDLIGNFIFNCHEDETFFKENMPLNYSEVDLNGNFKGLVKLNYNEKTFKKKELLIPKSFTEDCSYHNGFTVDFINFSFSNIEISNNQNQDIRIIHCLNDFFEYLSTPLQTEAPQNSQNEKSEDSRLNEEELMSEIPAKKEENEAQNQNEINNEQKKEEEIIENPENIQEPNDKKEQLNENESKQTEVVNEPEINNNEPAEKEEKGEEPKSYDFELHGFPANALEQYNIENEYFYNLDDESKFKLLNKNKCSYDFESNGYPSDALALYNIAFEYFIALPDDMKGDVLSQAKSAYEEKQKEEENKQKEESEKEAMTKKNKLYFLREVLQLEGLEKRSTGNYKFPSDDERWKEACRLIEELSESHKEHVLKQMDFDLIKELPEALQNFANDKRDRVSQFLVDSKIQLTQDYRSTKEKNEEFAFKSDLLEKKKEQSSDISFEQYKEEEFIKNNDVSKEFEQVLNDSELYFSLPVLSDKFILRLCNCLYYDENINIITKLLSILMFNPINAEKIYETLRFYLFDLETDKLQFDHFINYIDSVGAYCERELNELKFLENLTKFITFICQRNIGREFIFKDYKEDSQKYNNLVAKLREILIGKDVKIKSNTSTSLIIQLFNRSLNLNEYQSFVEELFNLFKSVKYFGQKVKENTIYEKNVEKKYDLEKIDLTYISIYSELYIKFLPKENRIDGILHFLKDLVSELQKSIGEKIEKCRKSENIKSVLLENDINVKRNMWSEIYRTANFDKYANKKIKKQIVKLLNLLRNMLIRSSLKETYELSDKKIKEENPDQYALDFEESAEEIFIQKVNELKKNWNSKSEWIEIQKNLRGLVDQLYYIKNLVGVDFNLNDEYNTADMLYSFISSFKIVVAFQKFFFPLFERKKPPTNLNNANGSNADDEFTEIKEEKKPENEKKLGYLTKATEKAFISLVRITDKNLNIENTFKLLYGEMAELIEIFVKKMRSYKYNSNYYSYYIKKSNLGAKITTEIKFAYLKAKSKERAEKIENISYYTNEFEIDRENPWQSTFQELSNIPPEKLIQGDIRIRFKNEAGIDAGGLKREWLTLLAKELFNPEFGLFKLSENKISYQPSSISFLVPNHLMHFRMLGRLIAKTIIDNLEFEVFFVKPFLKHILNRKLYINDLQDIDAELYNSMKWVLENDVECLGFTFNYETNYFDRLHMKDLIPNGSMIDVTNENKRDFVKAICQTKMSLDIEEQTKALITGIQDIIPEEELAIIDEKDLGVRLAGDVKIDVDEMEKYISSSYEPTENIYKWLFEVLREWNNEMRSHFLFFVFATYRVPIGGFKSFPVKIRQLDDKRSLPVAHTCFAQIDLPRYDSKEILVEKLTMAMMEGTGGFFIG